jgi:O-methyltransferase
VTDTSPSWCRRDVTTTPLVGLGRSPLEVTLNVALNCLFVETTTPTAVDLYLDLLALTLTRALFEDNDLIAGVRNFSLTPLWRQRVADRLAPALGKMGLELVYKRPYSREARENGRDWPVRAETMVGLKRLANARFCVESALDNGIPGDIIETGVWRGGTAIFMRGVLKAHGVTDRKVWLADSFQGLPRPDPTRYSADRGLDFARFDFLSVGVEQVRRNFERYGLMDDQVHFIVGWFRDTLVNAPLNNLAVLRLDGDLYESTVQALEPLYPRLSEGGYCIIDDYGTIDACAAAVTDYRTAHGIDDEILDIDGWGVYWRKGGS